MPPFPWFGWPERAADSRFWARAGTLVMLLVAASLYLLVNQLAAARGVTAFDPAQIFAIGGRTLDSRIPYLPWTALAYVGLFSGSYLLPALAYPKTRSGARELFRLFNGLIFITVAACVVFVVLPAEMTLRAVAASQDSAMPLHRLNLWIHRVDRPFNTWPCLHVAHPALIYLVVSHWIGRRGWAIAMWAAWAAVAASTLTTKQHFIWDVVMGGTLGFAYWRWKLRDASVAR